MRITKHIDWCSASILTNKSCVVLYPELDWRLVGAGMHGFKQRYEDMKTGMVSEEINDNPDMFTHLTMAGECLSEYRGISSRTDFDHLSYLESERGRVSRLDVTGNIHGGRLTPKLVKRALDRGYCKTVVKKWYMVNGSDDEFDGDTLYMGSKTSTTQVRVYDKNAKLRRKSDELWTRFEFQLRDEPAQNAHRAITRSSVASVFNSLMDKYFVWNNAEIDELKSGELADIEEVGRKQRKTVQWLLDTVSKSLAREALLDDNLIEMFLINTARHMADISDENEKRRSESKNAH